MPALNKFSKRRKCSTNSRRTSDTTHPLLISHYSILIRLLIKKRYPYGSNWSSKSKTLIWSWNEPLWGIEPGCCGRTLWWVCRKLCRGNEVDNLEPIRRTSLFKEFLKQEERDLTSLASEMIVRCHWTLVERDEIYKSRLSKQNRKVALELVCLKRPDMMDSAISCRSQISQLVLAGTDVSLTVRTHSCR